jgi:cytochrome c biogenesis protein CcdA
VVVKEADSEDELMVAIELELNEVVSKEVCDAVYENVSVTQKEDQKELNSECQQRKSVIMNIIAKSVSLQRLYFIVRSSIMGGITGLLTFIIISILRVTDFPILVLIGIVVFFVSLALSRIADKPIVKLSQKIVQLLKKHSRIRSVILRRL